MATAAPPLPADDSPRAPGAGDADAQRALVGPQESVSGTPRWRDGETLPDEYNRELADPIRRMQRFEELRTEEAVHTALETREKLALQANWLLSAPSDEPRHREIADFCEDNVYPVLDYLVERLMSAVHYGFAAVEPVFAWGDAPPARAIARGKVRRGTNRDGGRAIYLQKVADIRQPTIASFLVTEQGDLQALRQETFTAARYRKVDIAAGRVLLWTYKKRGDDFWGQPPTRFAYKAVRFKEQIERLNLLGLDRFGVGTPVASGGPGWTQADFRNLFEFLQRWRSGSDTALVTPHGGTVDIKGGQGPLVAAMLEWVKYYAQAIAKVYLTQGTELATTTSTGARALGEEFYEQSAGVVQADCEAIAALLNERLIIPLVDANFGPQDAYPTFAPSQRVRLSSAIGTLVKTLADAGAVHVTPQDEAWLRDALGMPSIPLDELVALEQERKAKADAIVQQAAAATGQQPPAPGAKPAPGEKPAPRPPVAARRALSFRLSVPAPAPKGQTYRTEGLGAFEQRILKPWNLSEALDVETARTAGEVQAVLRDIDLDLAGQVALLAAAGPTDAAATLDGVRVPARLRAQLRTVLWTAAQRARAMGAEAVLAEVERQRTPDIAAPARWSRAKARQVLARRLAAGAEDDVAREAQLRAHVELVVQEECARREGSARAALLAAIDVAPTAAPAELVPIAEARVKGALEDLSAGRMESGVSGVVNIGWGTGRSDGADAIRESGQADLVAMVYSAVLDFGTCAECAKWDGAWFPIDYDPTQPGNVKAPNPNCAGGTKRCRCLWTWVTAAEAPALIGPEKDFTEAPTPRPIPREVFP